MDTVIRAAAIYLLLLVIVRIGGRRVLGQMTNFDLILLLVIAEATSEALPGDDRSLTAVLLAVATLVGMDVALAWWKRRWPLSEQWIEGTPLILIDRGGVLDDRMRRSRVDAYDVLTAAREGHGLERLEQVKYAVLERSGHISVIPWPEGARPGGAQPGGAGEVTH